MVYVFPHVPKCGGTSLLKKIGSSGLKVKIDYDCWIGPKSEELNKKYRGINYLDFDIVYGHFPIRRYDSHDFKYIALVRDPVERCRSSYDFHRDEYTKQPNSTDLYTKIGKWIAKGELSFLEYIRIAPDMREVYKMFMCYWPKEKFSLIGNTNNYEYFIKNLSDLLKIDITISEKERETENKTIITEEEREIARDLLSEEYNWYNSFIK